MKDRSKRDTNGAPDREALEAALRVLQDHLATTPARDGRSTLEPSRAKERRRGRGGQPWDAALARLVCEGLEETNRSPFVTDSASVMELIAARTPTGARPLVDSPRGCTYSILRSVSAFRRHGWAVSWRKGASRGYLFTFERCAAPRPDTPPPKRSPTARPASQPRGMFPRHAARLASDAALARLVPAWRTAFGLRPARAVEALERVPSCFPTPILALTTPNRWGAAGAFLTACCDRPVEGVTLRCEAGSKTYYLDESELERATRPEAPRATNGAAEAPEAARRGG